MIKSLILSFISIFMVVAIPSTVFAAGASEDLQSVCSSNPNSSLCTGYKEGEDVQANDNAVLKLLKRIISILLFVAGVLAVIMVIYGGFKYVTSAGEPQKAASGRQTIIFALVGLIVVVISRQLILFVLDRLLK
jgi:magnesium-transporting ATPase (P-type)